MITPRVVVAVAALTIGVGLLFVGIANEKWILTAVPVGLLFGFFLQKGNLCGAAAMSEVLVLRDGRKLFGLWIAIAALLAMPFGFAQRAIAPPA